jgi:transcriptional regulator with XRE-family HTH domain
VTAGQRPEMAALGRSIRRLRQARRLSIRALAREAGMSSGHLSVIERGQGNPKISTLWSLAEALGVTVAQFTRF